MSKTDKHTDDGDISDMDSGDHEDPIVFHKRRKIEKEMAKDENMQKELEQKLLEQTIIKTLKENNNTKKRKKGGKMVKKSNFTARKAARKRKTLTFRRKITTRKSVRKSYRNPATK